jgi:HD-like signal output (HDOD) protein
MVFEEDPTLAQALLTQANSSAYGGGRPVLSVRDALQRLGVNVARNVLMGHTVSALLCRPGGRYAAMVDDVWQHMVRTAPIARRIASAFNADPEEAFGLGLLHDVGKLVIFDRLTTLRIELRREVVIPAADLSAILRALHEPLGGLAVHNWNLGDAAASAVASHHRTPVPALRDALSEVLCVAEAADIASVHGEDFDLASTWDRAVLGGSAIRVERALMAA